MQKDADHKKYSIQSDTCCFNEFENLERQRNPDGWESYTA